MSTADDGGMSRDLRRVLRDDETVHWHGGPDRRSLPARTFVSGVPLLCFLGPFVFGVAAFVVVVIGLAVEAVAGYLVVGLLLAAVVTLGTVFGGAYLVRRRACDLAEYAVTDRRLVRFGGLLGREYSTVEWTAVEDVEVGVGLVDDRYGTGSVTAITAGGGGVTFSNVRDPYGVLETVESARRGERG